MILSRTSQRFSAMWWGFMMTSMMIFVIFAYVAVLGFLYAFQRHLMYFPEKDMQSPEYYGLLDVTEQTLTTSDGIHLKSWYRAPKAGQTVLLYFHGNSGHLGNRSDKFRTFLQQPVGFLAVSYRGYGLSEGEPSEIGLYEDARTAIRFLLLQGISLSDVVLYGESLGTGVAVQMAIEFPQARALVLEAPYTSVTRRAKERFPYVPVMQILKDHYDSAGKIHAVQMPVLMFHGHQDQVIPFAHGRELLSLANEPKEGRWFPDVHHSDFNPNDLSQSVHEFIRRYPSGVGVH